jgi:hypothetical protein
MSDDWSIFEPPEKDQLMRHADDLIDRANLVRRHGWGEYRHRWSCGEVLGTALVLGDDTELQRCSETTDSALERWAYDLWGITGGQSDVDTGLQRTRAWSDSIRTAR